MFKGKVYLYKNINGIEVKVEKNFINEEEFNKYVEKNPDIKKLESDFKKFNFPKSFEGMKSFFDDFDYLFTGDNKKRIGYFDELSGDFEKILEKSKRFLEN